jgi:GNAT superfamily N-acetyltransferase
MSEPIPDIHYRAVTRATLPDLAAFSDCHGKFQYCSCMRWRMRSAEFQKSTKEIRTEKLRKMVSAGSPVGILAYAGNQPIGWCSIAPRESYEALERYKALPRVDHASVWSVVCFFVDRRFRRRQVTSGLLKAGLDYARSQGAKIVEGYPVGPGTRLHPHGIAGDISQSRFSGCHSERATTKNRKAHLQIAHPARYSRVRY